MMKKVLLLSASRHFLRRSTNLLKNQEFELFTSFSGADALTLHEESAFDLILCDYELADMNGCSFCTDVHASHSLPLVPVILICDDKIDCIAKVKQSDALAILLRPINPIHLLNTIGSFLDMQLVRNERVVFNANVLCLVDNFEFSCTSQDISTSGIILETEHHLELGSLISCRFTLPDICQLQPEGEIMRGFSLHNGKMLYGVKFLDLSVPDQAAIETYVTARHRSKQELHRPVEVSKNY